MSNHQATLLIVDDTPVNLLLISKFLEGCDYQLELANSGEEAWELLQAAPGKFDAVLLDRIMPGIDGMEVLRRIKQDAGLKLLPVILQTAASFPEQLAEGLRAGAYYYLTKPFDREVLRAVVATAIRDGAERIVEAQDVDSMRLSLSQLKEASFAFRTSAEAHRIAALLSSLCPAREAAHMGLMELMMNAIEHGNLGISYAEKTLLIAEDRLRAEIERRLALPEFADKIAAVKLTRLERSLLFTITDEGDGFDWKPYLEMSMERMMDNHGRGIAMSRSISFASLEYRGKGNCVDATILIPES